MALFTLLIAYLFHWETSYPAHFVRSCLEVLWAHSITMLLLWSVQLVLPVSVSLLTVSGLSLLPLQIFYSH